jgi:hypothetical protein
LLVPSEYQPGAALVTLSVTKITDEVLKGRTVSLNSEVGEEHTSDVTAVENITEKVITSSIILLSLKYFV